MAEHKSIINPEASSQPFSPPIGILDSGVGGLSVMKEICRELPHQDIHYIGDSAWCPYGNKDPEKIIDRVFKLTDRLLELGCGLVVIACNSATICAVEALRAQYLIPFTGMEPAVKPAAKMTRSGVIGVLATEASLAGEKFHRLVNTHGGGIRIITTPSPTFVDLVEQGTLEGEDAETAVREYTTPMLEHGADVLVLGCTHYPFLRPTIQKVVGESITLVDTGAAVARQARRLFEENYTSPDKQNTIQERKISVSTTGELEHLKKLFPVLCPKLEAELSKLSM